jgi:hypothetical protein
MGSVSLLTPERLERLQRSLALALNQEWPQLTKVQRELAQLRPTAIRSLAADNRTVPIVATVATDGGENRLNLEPIRVQVVRVADSTGEIYFEDFIPLSLAPQEITRFYFKSEPRLQKFLDYLECGWDALLPRTEFQRSNLLAMLRELMEWAALLKLASQPPAKLLVRDGLLRSVLLTDAVFQALRKRFEALTCEHGHLLVGVAKRSRVISYLSVALGLNESFADGQASYLVVPAELEREAAPEQYRWIGARAMGQLHMARLDRGEAVPLMPVDIAAWQTPRAAEVMALLHESSRGSFPSRGYPYALIQAHQHARVGGMELEVLERMLLDQVAALDPAAARQARILKLLGRQLVEELADDQPTES